LFPKFLGEDQLYHYWAFRVSSRKETLRFDLFRGSFWSSDVLSGFDSTREVFFVFFFPFFDLIDFLELSADESFFFLTTLSFLSLLLSLLAFPFPRELLFLLSPSPIFDAESFFLLSFLFWRLVV